MAGMVGVITAVLVGAEAGLGVVTAFEAPAVALVAGCAGAIVVLLILMEYQRRIWLRPISTPITEDPASASRP